MKVLLEILLFMWQLPQNFLGLLFFLIVVWDKEILNIGGYSGSWIFIIGNNWGGISLGRFVFLCHELNDFRHIGHEYGHCKQSIMFGPLYLLIIGLPSISWAIFHSITKSKKNCYGFWTEKWADKLGGLYK